MSLNLRGRGLDWTLRVVGVLVIGALAFLLFTVWQGEQQRRESSLSSRAIANLLEIVRENPENPDARVLLGDAYRDTGSYTDAVEQYDAALDIKEDHVAALSGLALTAMAEEEWRTAEGYWQKVIDIASKGQYAAADMRLEKAYYYYGVTLIQVNEYEDAIGYLKEALRMRRDDADSHYALSTAYGKIGSVPNQKKSLEAALAFVPAMPEANYDLGLILLAEGDKPGAAELFRRSTDNAPGRAEPRQELEKLGPFADRLASAQALAATDPAGALSEARIAAALDPDNPDAARLVARLLQQLGNKEEASIAWAHVLELVPDDPEALEQVEILNADS